MAGVLLDGLLVLTPELEWSPAPRFQWYMQRLLSRSMLGEEVGLFMFPVASRDICVCKCVCVRGLPSFNRWLRVVSVSGAVL